MSPAPLLISFSHKVHNIRNDKQYSTLTGIELGPSALESSIRISNSYVPTDGEHKLHERGVQNCLPTGVNLG